MRTTTPNATNRAVENAAIAFVLAYQATHGRLSHDTRGTGATADVAGDVRTIEVKAYGGSARPRDMICGWRRARSTRPAPTRASGSTSSTTSVKATRRGSGYSPLAAVTWSPS
jgi:hypothetical protein